MKFIRVETQGKFPYFFYFWYRDSLDMTVIDHKVAEGMDGLEYNPTLKVTEVAESEVPMGVTLESCEEW